MKTDNKFIVECRYETWTSDGKQWSNWFISVQDPITEEEGKTYIKEAKKNCQEVDKKTKLKHEYRLKDYNEYLKETKEFEKELEKNIKHQEKYFASEEYKELQKKKRKSAKERKEKQKKYMEEHMNV